MLVCFFLFVHNQNQAWRILNQTDSIEVKEKKNLKERRATIILPFPQKAKTCIQLGKIKETFLSLQTK